VKRTIRFTPPAQAQFLHAIDYIKSERPSAAQVFRDLAFKEISRLVEFPQSGRVIPEYPTLGFREILVRSYRFFYKEHDSVVWVVGVWHDAQLPAEPEEPSGG